MQSMFHPHPYSTAVGLLTERATDSGQLSEDWSLILEVCDSINESNDGPKEAARAIRKRFTSSAGKDHICIWYTLLLLEACVKNCGRRFHCQVANKEFLHDFLKILSPKNEPSQELQDKVLFMLKSWVEYNWDVPGRRDLEKVYNTLLRKGIQFPNAAPEGLICGPSEKFTFNGTCAHSPPAVTGSTSSPHRSKSASCSQSVRSLARHSHPITTPATSRNPCNVCRTHHTQNGMDARSCSPSSQFNRSSFSPGQNVRIRTVQGTQLRTYPNRVLFHHTRPCHSTPTIQRVSESVLVHSVPNSMAGILHTCRHERSIPSDRMVFDLDGTVRHLTSVQRIKLMQDLSVVETNVNLLNDMLAELRPDTVGSDDLTLLQELHQTCRSMHLRVMAFLGQVSDEEATPALLQVNDNLNSAFMRYERFERYRSQAVSSKPVSTNALDATNVRSGQLSITCSSEKSLLALTSTDSHESPGSSLPLTRFDRLDDDDDDDPLLDVTDTPNSNNMSMDHLADWIADRQLVPVSRATSNRQTDKFPGALDHVTRGIDHLALVPAYEPSRKSFPPANQNESFQAINSITHSSIVGTQFTTPPGHGFVTASASSVVGGRSRSKSAIQTDLLQF